MTASSSSQQARTSAERPYGPPATTASSKLDALAVDRPFLPLLVFLFVGSGCAALIYEIVWFQLLQLIIGSSAVSMGVLLATFMGGMCLGSLFLSRYISNREHPLRVYAMLEGAIGILGIIVFFALPYIGGLYLRIGGPGFSGLLFRGMLCAICLLPPTLLMGATLPAIARWVESTPAGVSWLGFFYGGNIAGAVLGCAASGFYFLRVHDMEFTTFVAVAINAAVAISGYLLSQRVPYAAPAEESIPGLPSIPAGSWPIYVTTALSGMSALAAEVVWTRILSLLLGATVYTFSLILAAFLIGLGIGSSVGAVLAKTIKNPRAALGWCQLMLMAAIAWAAYSMAQALPYWPINPQLSIAPHFIFEIDLVRALWVVLPGAILWGASFPLALAAVGAQEKDPARLVGGLYAANTVGGIVGALFGSLLMVAWVGTQHTQQVMIVLVAISAMLVLVPTVVDQAGKLEVSTRGAVLGAVSLGLAAVLAMSVHSIPPMLVAYGRFMTTWLGSDSKVIYWGEGVTATVAVSQRPNGVLNYHNAGKVQASSEPQDMHLQRMLGHFTTLVPAHPSSVLVIGFGAGVTAGAVSVNPDVTSETIAEIEPLVPKVVGEYFGTHNYEVAKNPKVHVVIDDARHFVLTTKEKFDAVTSDPLDPWVRGAATLYTKEFFDVVKEHLNPGGVVTLFVQLYESTPAAVKSEVATFMQAFPNGVVWGNTENGVGYDLVLLGQVGGTHINVDAIQAKLDNPRYAPVAQSLAEININSAVDLFSTFAAEGPQLKGWMADAQVNHDMDLRLQYLAGLGLNLYEQASIYKDMLAYRQYPQDLFTGSPMALQQLQMAIQMQGGGAGQ